MKKLTYEELINDAKSKDIHEVARMLGLTIVGRGHTVTTAEMSSLTLYKKSGVDDFKRFSENGGNSGGSCIDLVMHIRSCSFKEAVEYLTGSNIASKNIDFSLPVEPPPPPEPMDIDYLPFMDRFWDETTGVAAREYANGVRKITYETLSECNIGYTVVWVNKEFPSEPAVCFPYYDTEGRLMGVRYRVINDDVPKENRMRSLKGSSFKYSMYGSMMPIIKYHERKKPTVYHEDTAFIFEGEFNALAGRTVGFNCVSVGGQLMDASEALIDYCRQFKKAVVWFDEIEHSERVADQIRRAITGIRVQTTTSLILGGGQQYDANDMLKQDYDTLGQYLNGFAYVRQHN